MRIEWPNLFTIAPGPDHSDKNPKMQMSENRTVKASSTDDTTVLVVNGPPAWKCYYDTSNWVYGWTGSKPSYSFAFHQMLRGNCK